MGLPTANPWPAGLWRRHLADAVTEIDELLDLLDLDASCLGDPAGADDSARSFGLRVPRGYVQRMRLGDAADPLLRQVLPVDRESRRVAGFSTDPLHELEISSGGGVLQKYPGRALVMVTGACAVHCRYCFRRHFPYDDHGGLADGFDEAVAAVLDDPTITEVILSGGDPLALPDSVLKTLISRFVAVPHVRRLRLHSRMPVVLPQRIDTALIDWIGDLGLPVVVVVHANHAHEIDVGVSRAVAALTAAGVTVLNQSVLLAGINDSVDALVDLSETLFDVGVMPYYLHLLDPVEGAAHFDVSDDAARALIAGVQARLPGYLVPRLVREVPGAPSKVGVDLWP